MKPESNRPVSIEDLLRLKRAERPPAEFWGEFDRQLRSKQLAALVAKRPWWQRLPRLVPTFVRYRFVLGGTAVAAMAFVTLRDEPAAVMVERVVSSDSLMATPVAAEIGDIVRVFDPVAYAASLLVIVASCALAVSVPALRAAGRRCRRPSSRKACWWLSAGAVLAAFVCTPEQSRRKRCARPC